MANPEHVAIVRQGAGAIARWREEHPRGVLDLGKANLVGANLLGANLSGADLSGADLTQAVFGSTSLGGVDLSQVAGLASATHVTPSSVGTDTLIASFRGAGNRLTPELLTAFFRGAGVPKELLDALPRILAEVKYYTCFISYGEPKELLDALPRILAEVKYYTCFISYGQPDVAFAKKLYEDLTARGVTCWLYERDKTPGERTWREITEKRRGADKMLVLCSLKALFRGGMKKEIEEQIDEDPDKIIPISLDDDWQQPGVFVMRAPGSPDHKPFLLERNYADFADPARYDEQLAALLRVLRRRDIPIA